jgi:hypothetical protein
LREILTAEGLKRRISSFITVIAFNVVLRAANSLVDKNRE